MLKEWRGRTPKYFYVLFGEKYASEHPVDGGVYHHHKGYIDGSGVAVGDVLLLYCASELPRYFQEAPGVGVVIGIETGGEEEVIRYQPFPLDPAVPWDIIKDLQEVKEHQPSYFRGNWLYELSQASFKKALEGRQIDWP